MPLQSARYGDLLRWIRSSAQGRRNQDVVDLADATKVDELHAVVRVLSERLDATWTSADQAVSSLPGDQRLHASTATPAMIGETVSGLELVKLLGTAITLSNDAQTIRFQRPGLYFVQAAVNFGAAILATPVVDLSIQTSGGVGPGLGRGTFRVTGGLLLSAPGGGGGAWMVRVEDIPASVNVIAAITGGSVTYFGVDVYRVGV